MLKPIEILKAILDNSPDGIILISPNHEVIAFNKTIEDRMFTFFGKNIAAGDDARDFIFMENKNLYLTQFAEAVKGENVFMQLETKTANFSIWFEYRFNAVYNTSQELVGVTITAKNIDKEKKAEIELEKLSETIEAIFENTTESIVFIGPDLTILSFNKIAFERVKAIQNKELFIGADFRNYVYESRNTGFTESFNNALKGKISISEVEVTDYKGNPVWYISRIQPLYNHIGELLGITLFTQHITEKKLAEIALRENEEKFKKIVESTPTPIIMTDQDMKIILVNSQTEKVFGFSPEDLYGKNIRLLIPKHLPNKEKKEDNSLINKLNIPEIKKHTTAFTKSGKEILIETGISTFVLNNKKYIIAIVQDVTLRIKYEEQIANQLKRLQAIAWQQSHEIRRPLSNILGVFELMKLEPNATDVEKQIFYDLLLKSAQELDLVIHNIVDHTT